MSAAITPRLRAYFEDRPGVVSAYLFGSHAEGRVHAESDVDVGVLLDRERYPAPRDRFGERVRLSSELIGLLHRNEVDVVVLNDAPPLLGRHVVVDGVQVHCSDVRADREFVRVVQIRAADIGPFLERLRPLKLQALRR